MIKTIEINNFQSHSNTVLELSKGVNVIKGRSHSGKSSIIRALKWALLNDPNRGDYFTSRFVSKKDITSVGIEFDDESYIIRKKAKGVNSYDLSTGDLPTIGTDLPEEVKAITKIAPINIQSQDEQYYMIKETPGKVAKELNSLVGLDIIDQTLSKLNKLENENTVKLKLLEKDSEEIKTGLEDLDFVDNLEARVEHIEDLWKSYQELINQKRRIIELSESIKEEDEFIKETKDWLAIKEPVDDLKTMIGEYAEVKKSLDLLLSLYSDINSSEKSRLSSSERVGNLNLKRDSILKSELYKKEFCPECGSHISNWRKQ